MAKWRDTAWKDILCDIPQSAVEYLMPDLAAKMNPTAELRGIPGMELFAKSTGTDEGMREPDAFFNVPMLDGENRNVALFYEQQHEPNVDLPKKIFDVYVRVREKWQQPTTCVVIYTGSSPNVDTYVESCYGCEVSMKFRTYYLPEKNIDELRADNHPFARVMLAARLSLDAGNDVKLREKYATEIAETTAENEQKMFILDFTRRILRLDADEISESVRGVYTMQTIPLEEYRKQIRLQGAREETREEIARSMLEDGMPLPEVAKYTRLPVKDLQDLMPQSPTS
jgi:hypothetical protein